MSADILLVDDDPTTVEILRLFLEREGHDVASAPDGGEALRYLREHGPPRLILLDLSMPGLDGCGFLEALARQAHWSVIPVVVVTGRADVSAQQVIDLGADGLLRKPVDPDDLLAVVDRYSGVG
jgi:CheY-like chemotaxis protein